MEPMTSNRGKWSKIWSYSPYESTRTATAGAKTFATLPDWLTCTPIRVLAYYDEPVLYVGENFVGDRYLVMLARLEGELHRWLYAQLSPARLDDLCAGTIDLHDAFANVEGGFVFEVVEESGGPHWRSVPVADIDPDEFPVPGERVRPRPTD